MPEGTVITLPELRLFVVRRYNHYSDKTEEVFVYAHSVQCGHSGELFFFIMSVDTKLNQPVDRMVRIFRTYQDVEAVPLPLLPDITH